MAFALAPSIPVAALRDEFAARRRVEVRPFLDERSAALLRAHLLERQDWHLVLNAGDKVFEIARPALRDMPAAQRERLEAMVLERARTEFQYRFESIRVADPQPERARSATLLDDFAEFLCSAEVLSLFRAIVGSEEVSFVDAQATSYGPGDFLTRHDDDVAGKNRKAAYVLGLTPGWRPEWGGLLMFHAGEDRIEEAFGPAMGTLRLFAVPVSHSVSYVAPIAPEPRLSVTGWLRTARPAEGASV